MVGATILVIHEQSGIRRAIALALLDSGVRVLEATTVHEGIQWMIQHGPDVIICDASASHDDGVRACLALRRWSTAPVLVLTARRTEAERIAMLRAGADDCIAEPFGVGELVAKIEAHFRRLCAPTSPKQFTIESNGVTIDIPARVVRREQAIVHLSATEWSIIEVLASRLDFPVPLQEIFNAVWGVRNGNASQYVRVYVTYLRRKLERDRKAPRIILTEHGVGYRLATDVCRAR